MGVKQEYTAHITTIIAVITVAIVRFEVLAALNTKITIFWDITPYSPLNVNRRFGGTYRLHLQGRKISQTLLVTCFHAGFLPGLFFDPEDEGDMFLRNVC
jgi:hypothetical protein